MGDFNGKVTGNPRTNFDRPETNRYRVSVLEDGKWLVRRFGLIYGMALKVKSEYEEKGYRAKVILCR